MSLIVAFGFSSNVYASEQPNNVTENEAIELAKWFIANDIYENNNNGWDNTIDVFYKINSGSLWISATKYWVN